MNTRQASDDEIAQYVATVEDALQDLLPADTRAALVADLVDHLTEIAGEITMAVPRSAIPTPPP